MHFAMAVVLKCGDFPRNGDSLFLPFPGHPLHARLKGIKNISSKLLGTNLSEKRNALGALGRGRKSD